MDGKSAESTQGDVISALSQTLSLAVTVTVERFLHSRGRNLLSTIGRVCVCEPGRQHEPEHLRGPLRGLGDLPQVVLRGDYRPR